MQAQKLEPTLRGGQDSTVTWEEQWTGGEGRQVQACRPAGEGRPWRQGSDRAQWGPYPPSFAATGHAGHSRPWPGHGPCLGSGDVQPSPGERDHCALQLPQPLPPLNLLGWALRRGGGGTPGWVGLPLPLPLRTPESRPPDGPRAGSQPPESRPRRSRVPLSILDGLTRCPLGPVCPFAQGWRLCPDLSTPQMPLGLSLAVGGDFCLSYRLWATGGSERWSERWRAGVRARSEEQAGTQGPRGCLSPFSWLVDRKSVV